MIRRLAVAAINLAASLAERVVTAWPNLTGDEDGE